LLLQSEPHFASRDILSVMPYRGGVQLIPDIQKRPTLGAYTRGNRWFWSGVGLGVALIVIWAIFNGYAGNLQDQIAKLDGQLIANEKMRDKDKEGDLIAAYQQSKVFRQLLAGKSYWSKALLSMEQMTLSSTVFTQLSASLVDQTITFQGSSTNYQAVARQLASFTANTGITDVSLQNIKTTPGGVEFNGILKLDSKKLINR